MSGVEEIEAAIRRLPSAEQTELVRRIQPLLWDAWDRRIEEDGRSGRLNHLMAEVEADIAASRTKPLDEVLDNA